MNARDAVNKTMQAMQNMGFNSADRQLIRVYDEIGLAADKGLFSTSVSFDHRIKQDVINEVLDKLTTDGYTLRGYDGVYYIYWECDAR
jgi:hypothetical protein